ncbi:MAG: FAD-dependent oxidoreductase [Treponema sp.]|nr:FAD-dependent oxidoreductase [Treponema sp.]
MTKKISGLAVVVLALSLLFTACPTEFNPFGEITGSHNDHTGWVYGIARGFSSDIRVDLRLENGFIKEATVRSVAGRESPGWYQGPFNMAPLLIVARNSVELDTLAGASRTTQGIVNAGRAALAGIPPPGTLPRVERPGRYVQPANGFGGPFYVSVTLNTTAITRIAVEISNESSAVGQPAINIMIDRMLEAQNSYVDGVSGATITSDALRLAVGAALAEAGAPMGMRTRPEPENGERHTNPQVTVDVIVIGSGAAGLSAAIAAASAQSFPPVSVMLIEKQEFLGGSTIRSDGIIYAPEPTEATGPASSFVDYFMYRAQGYANRALLSTYASGSLDIVSGNWALPGLQHRMATGISSRERARPFPGGGVALVRTLENRARERGVGILTGVEAVELVKNSNGEVVRVLAESMNSNFVLNARRGVVIATGGFDNDRGAGSLMAEHNADSLNSVPRSSRGNTGQGIRMGQYMGAGTVFKGGMFGSVAIDPTIDFDIADIVNGHNIIFITDSGTSDFIDLGAPEQEEITDVDGNTRTLDAVQWGNATHDMIPNAERTDPSVLFNGLTRVLENHPNSRFFQISDRPLPRRGHITHEVIARSGLAFHSMSFAGLAIAMWHGTVDSADIQAAFTARGWENLPGGFYVWRIHPVTLGSMGGLRINPQAQVLDTAGNPIPGLFAAGEAANGDFFFQQNPAPGSSLGIALTFGRIAGEQAAQSQPRLLLP